MPTRADIRRLLEQIALPRFPGPPIQQTGHFLPADALILIQARKLAQRGYDPVPGPTSRSHGLDQRPVLVRFAVLSPAVAS
jgi:hypothetical protein